jgi:Glycosyl hydrolase family 10
VDFSSLSISLGKLGLTVNISEMDVRVSRLPEELRQTAQKQIYHDIVAAALTEPAVDGIWLWGFTDMYTWVSHFYCKDEPLIFDQDYNRKEAYYSFRDALSTLIVGGIVGGNVLLDSDVDDDGNQWGHLWMQPDPEDSEDEALIGDSRPDWEHEVI